MKQYGKLLSLALIVLLLSTTVLVAGDRNRIGTAGAMELLIPVGARGLALGGSTLSNVTGAEALYWNPAGAARSANNYEFTFSNYDYFADIKMNYVGAMAKISGLGTIGITLKSVAYGDIPVTTEEFPDGTGAMFSPAFTAVGVSYSTYLIDRVAVGVQANFLSQSIMNTRASGVAASVGIQYVGLGVQGLNIGIAIRNVGSSYSFEGSDLYRWATYRDNPDRQNELLTIKTSPNELPTTFEMGASYMQKLDDQNAIELSGNFINNNYYDDEYKVGMEYTFDNMIFARGSYSLAPTSQKDVLSQDSFMYTYSFGVGLKTNFEGVSLGVDYCYQAMKYFGANNMFTVSMGF
ncbi:MAG: PorV/PorQ family protein [bacterium]